MSRIELPSGNGAWIDLRDPESITAGDYDDLIGEMPQPDTTRPGKFAVKLSHGMQLLMITDWFVPYLDDPQALPRAKPKQLRDLKIADRRALEEALLPAQKLLFPTPPSVDDEQLDDPASPTTPVSA